MISVKAVRRNRARQWGRDCAIYANRVLGEFHASDEDSVIPLSWVEAAVERWHLWDQAGRPALEGRWVGAKVGLFSTAAPCAAAAGHADFDYFRVR